MGHGVINDAERGDNRANVACYGRGLAMGLRAVIFDLDDTLLDTSALLDARDRRAWGEVFGRFAEVRVFDVSDGEHAVTSLPAQVRGLGLAVGLYTHSPGRYATELLREHGMRVDEMVTGSDGFPSKPDPSGLLAVARALDIPASECLYVGDSVGDFGAAAAAGMMSVGVSWMRRTPESWRHGWPDVAVDRPSRLLRLVGGATDLGPLGEVKAAGVEPAVHWGSVMRLGGGTVGLGRYFPMGDRRYPQHPLSHLIIDSKDELSASEALAEVFGAVAARLRDPPQIIASVPPRPSDERDRFDLARAVVAGALNARDGGGLLGQRHAVDDYKRIPRDARAGAVADLFEVTTGLAGERCLLIDDVLTSGAQSNACREALLAAGAGPVNILVATVTQDALPEPCPQCGEEFGGTVRTKRRRRDGKEFQGCSRWPDCGWSRDLPT